MAHGPIGEAGSTTSPIEIKISWTLNASKMQTGFSLRRNAALLGTPQDAATHAWTALQATFLPLLPSAATITGIDAVEVVSKIGGTVSPQNVVGGFNAAYTHQFLVGVLSLKGELRARTGQGRMFLPAMVPSFIDTNIISTAGRAAMTAFAEALRTNYIGTTVGQEWTLTNWHPLLPATRPHKSAVPPLEIPASYSDVVSYRVNPVLSMLRSRKVGVGS